jgi:hypothetical protein
MAWHRTRWASPLLRLAGAALLTIACLAAFALFTTPQHPPGTREALFAALLFTTASAGSALLILGAHLFDSVEVSPAGQGAFDPPPSC